MRIGIIGSGVVGQTLSQGFLKHGYEVMIGSRELRKLEEWKSKSNYSGLIGNFKETADFGEIIVLAIKGMAAKEALTIIKEQITEKTIIDTTNPIDNSPPENGVLKFFTSLNKSLMEQLQEEFPKANFVKAFSCIGSAHMVNPNFKDKPTMFICGNSEQAKSQVKEILNKFGFEVEDMGHMQAARAIEPLCMLWCIPGFLRSDWNHAFKLLK